MGTPPEDLDRRTFLQAAGAAAFGLPVAGSAGQAAAQPAGVQPSTLGLRRLLSRMRRRSAQEAHLGGQKGAA